MKLTTAITAIVSVLGIQQAQSHVEITPGSPGTEGVPYRWTIEMGNDNIAEILGSAGAWAWEDTRLLGDSGGLPVGWTHNANWLALSFEGDSLLTIRVESRDDLPDPNPANTTGLFGPDLIPGFTLYAGWDITGGSDHFFLNREDIPWAESLTYLMNPEPNGTQILETTVTVPAGLYTLVLGGAAASGIAGSLPQGYQATFTTTPVPEPGSAALALIGGIALLGRRRKLLSRL